MRARKTVCSNCPRFTASGTLASSGAVADGRRCMARRRRLRRLTTGMAVSAVTLLLLFIVLEIAVRLFVGEEVFSFRPVFRAHPA